MTVWFGNNKSSLNRNIIGICGEEMTGTQFRFQRYQHVQETRGIGYERMRWEEEIKDSRMGGVGVKQGWEGSEGAEHKKEFNERRVVK